MPELPEVETVKRGLAQVMTGERITKVEQRRPDLRFALPPRLAERLEGRTVRQLGRRAKYILVELDDGEVLLMHLGMTGRFTIRAPAGDPPAPPEYTFAGGVDPRHDHVVLHLASGASVTFNDARRFGYMDLVSTTGLSSHKHLRGLGVEPLSGDLTPAYLAEQARGRRTSLKALLMDQGVIAGLGNIYVCEALWRARLRPTRSASILAGRSGHAASLIGHIRDVLEEAIAAGGSSLRDYVQTDGREGAFQVAHAVYGREGEPCLRPGCGGLIRRIVQSGRSTFYCPRCQR